MTTRTKRKTNGNADTTGTVRCDRCGAVMAAIDFNVHECAKMRPLSELPIAILRKLAYGEISEAEAWHLAETS